MALLICSVAASGEAIIWAQACTVPVTGFTPLRKAVGRYFSSGVFPTYCTFGWLLNPLWLTASQLHSGKFTYSDLLSSVSVLSLHPAMPGNRRITLILVLSMALLCRTVSSELHGGESTFADHPPSISALSQIYGVCFRMVPSTDRRASGVQGRLSSAPLVRSEQARERR